MADNYLERRMDEYIRSREAAARQRRLKWQKQLKAYKQRQATEATTHSPEKP